MANPGLFDESQFSLAIDSQTENQFPSSIRIQCPFYNNTIYAKKIL